MNPASLVAVGRGKDHHQQHHLAPCSLVWPCVGNIPSVAFVSFVHMFQMGLFERVRRFPLLKSDITASSTTSRSLTNGAAAASSTITAASSKLQNRHQRELQKLLRSDGSSKSSHSSSYSSSSSSSSSSPWNQDAVLQLVQQHPQVCKVTYDFSYQDDDNNHHNHADKSQEADQHTFADHQHHRKQNTTNTSWCQYPLWRILQMTPLPSLPLLQAVYQAYPQAVFQTDPLGNNILHFLCSQAKGPGSHHHHHHQSNNNNSNHHHHSIDSTTLLLSLMRYLIHQEPQLVQRTSTTSGATPLHVAVRFGTNMDVVQWLVESYPAALYATTLASAETPLHWACQNTHLSFVSAVVPYLLQQDELQQPQEQSSASLNDDDDDTNSSSISTTTTSAVQDLLHATNQRGESCLHILLQHHRQAAAPATGSSALSSSSPSSPPTRHVRASTRMFISILQIMLDRDTTQTLLSLPDVLGRVPLHLALSFGCYPLEVIQFLVQEQPQTLWVRDLSGFTPVHRACLYPAHLEILNYVLQVKLNSSGTKNKNVTNSKSSPHNPKKQVVDGSGAEDDDSTGRTASITSPSSTPPSSPSSSQTSSPARATVQITANLMAGALQAPIDSQDTGDAEEHVDTPQGDDKDDHIKPPPPPPPLAKDLSFVFRVKDEESEDGDAPSPPTPLMRLPTRSGALPLHVACEFWTSLAVVQTLVEQDREALGLVDEQGCTPLHLACASRAPYDLLQYLVQQYPQALQMEDHQGRLPLHVTLETIPQRGHALHPPSSTIVELMLGRELLLLLGQEEDHDVDDDDDEEEQEDSKKAQTTARHTVIRKATTLQGETGFDIATRHHAPAHILALLDPNGNVEGKPQQARDDDDHHRYSSGEKTHTPPLQHIHVPTSKEIIVPMSWQDDWMLGDDTAGHDWEDLYQRMEI